MGGRYIVEWGPRGVYGKRKTKKEKRKDVKRCG
jgi:hypothetical protein